MFGLGYQELLLILVIVLILFGAQPILSKRILTEECGFGNFRRELFQNDYQRTMTVGNRKRLQDFYVSVLVNYCFNCQHLISPL